MKAEQVPIRKTRKRSVYSTVDGDQHAFDLMMARFDTVDADNHEIKLCVAEHIAKDAEIHAGMTKTIDTHGTYWKLLLKVTGACLVGVIAWYLK